MGGGGSSGGKSGVVYSVNGVYGDSPDVACRAWLASVGSDSTKAWVGAFTNDYIASCSNGSVDSSVIKEKLNNYSETECNEKGFKQIKGTKGSFSVVCTYKHKPKSESSTVGSTGSSSSSNKQDAQSTSPNGSSAGGGGGGGRSGADHATTPDSGKQGGGKNVGSGQDGTTGGSGQDGTTGGSGSSGTTGGSGGSETSGGSGTTGTTGGSGASGTNGSGDGGGGQDSELPDVPDSPFGNGDGEPDWGGLKSNGDFGTFRPSSAFSTGGACPQDITLDFGQFGVHQLPMSYVCMAVEKLRYVFIFLAYLVSAMMVFRTVNSMKG